MRKLVWTAALALVAVIAAVETSRGTEALRPRSKARPLTVSTPATVSHVPASPSRDVQESDSAAAIVRADVPIAPEVPAAPSEVQDDPRRLAAWILDRSDEELAAFERTGAFNDFVARVVRGLSTADRNDRASVLELDAFLTHLNQRVLAVRKNG